MPGGHAVFLSKAVFNSTQRYTGATAAEFFAIKSHMTVWTKFEHDKSAVSTLSCCARKNQDAND